MGVVVTPSNGPDFTWVGSTFTWSDPKSALTWETSHPIIYDAQITEAFASADGLSNSVGKAISEALGISNRNLLTYSEQFDNAVWPTFGWSVTPGSILSPIGDMTADTITSVSGAAALSRLFTATSTSHTFSIYFKSGTYTGANILLRNNTTATGLTYQAIAAGIDVGNGWFRLSVSASTGISIGDQLGIYFGATSAVTTGQYFYAWGAQLEVGAVLTNYARNDANAASPESLGDGQLSQVMSKALVESLATTDVARTNFSQTLAESLTTTELLSNGYALNSSEAFGTTESLKHSYMQALAEAFATIDASLFSFNWPLNFGESLTVTDSQGVSFSQSIQELLSTIEMFSDAAQYHLNVFESLATTDATSQSYTQALTETFATADSLSKAMTQLLAETLTTADTLSHVASQSLTETFATADVPSANYAQKLSEAFATSDSNTVQFQYAQFVSEAVSLAESFSKISMFYLAVQEAIIAGENQTDANVRPPLLLSESFTLQDVLSNAFISNQAESLTTAELLSERLEQSLSETITVADSEGKIYTIKVSEALSTIDAYVRKANAVFSNMVINAGDLTQLAFDDLVDNGKIVGYDRFREFIPGDYSYQKAMFRAILQSANDDRARLNTMKVTVDVPDIFDRGSATIGSTQTAGIVITFARVFHIIPEITVTLKGGTIISIPVVSSPSLTEFTVMLKDPSSNTGVTGSLSWAAHGY